MIETYNFDENNGNGIEDKEVVLSLENLVKSYGEVQVLKNVSIDIYSGEFLTLLGPSGCGKSTTLRAIAGLEKLDGGVILLEGTDITSFEPNKRNVNTVFQNYALFPHMNIFDNIAYGPKLRKVGKEVIRTKVEEMLELVKMEGLGQRMPTELSGGQRQRIAIARALINEPKILLLDEPLGALDLRLRKHMQSELKRIQRKTGITFIYVTHDQEEALSMSDRLAIMNNGVFMQIGTPKEIYDKPSNRFVAEFVGERNIFEREGSDCVCAVHCDKVEISDKKGDETDIEGEIKEISVTGSVTNFYVEIKKCAGIARFLPNDRPDMLSEKYEGKCRDFPISSVNSGGFVRVIKYNFDEDFSVSQRVYLSFAEQDCVKIGG